VKILDENDLAIKMNSGAYLMVDRVGLYYKELSFLEKYGFELLPLHN
jgi:hypothetical protein